MCYYPLTRYLCCASASTHHEPPSPCREAHTMKPFPYPTTICPLYRASLLSRPTPSSSDGDGDGSGGDGGGGGPSFRAPLGPQDRLPVCPNAKWEPSARRLLTVPIKCPTCTMWFTTRMGVSTLEREYLYQSVLSHFPTLRPDYVEQRHDEIMCLVHERVAKEVAAKTREVEQEWERAMRAVVDEVLKGTDFDLVRCWGNVRGVDYDALRREKNRILAEEASRNPGFSRMPTTAATTTSSERGGRRWRRAGEGALGPMENILIQNWDGGPQQQRKLQKEQTQEGPGSQGRTEVGPKLTVKRKNGKGKLISKW